MSILLRAHAWSPSRRWGVSLLPSRSRFASLALKVPHSLRAALHCCTLWCQRHVRVWKTWRSEWPLSGLAQILTSICFLEAEIPLLLVVCPMLQHTDLCCLAEQETDSVLFVLRATNKVYMEAAVSWRDLQLLRLSLAERKCLSCCFHKAADQFRTQN